MVELLSTKLFIPRLRPNLVPRPHLVERINAGLDRKLTLIAAPAGFGKTTLLSDWIPVSPRCVTWLSLDEGENDPTQFWVYFISSLQGLRSDLGVNALALLQSAQAPPITPILTALINELSAFSDPFAIVLEDYHHIESQSIHEALNFLIAHLPANMHLVMTTRTDPPLPLARLRARDKLTELRANDLRFNVKETAAFLTQTMGLNLSREEVSALERRTEGWIAGLQIAALSMQSRDNNEEFIQAFSGSHRHILGYLADEALNQRPKGTLKFLIQTSILERLCGPLCDAVTGDSSGQAFLEELERANLFITALDDMGIWYRYHPLFAEVLQARLQQSQREQVAELHRRAGNWHARQGMIDEAIRHATAGADFGEAANLIEAAAGDMVRRGSSASLIRWLDGIPLGIIQTKPRLCLARAWTFHWGPVVNLEKAEEWAQIAMQTALADGALDSSLTGEVAALQAMIAATRGENARNLKLSQQALDDLPGDSPWRSAVALGLGTVYFDSGDFTTAAHVFGEALRLSKADGTHYIQLAAASFLADIQVFQGHLSYAMELYQEVLDSAGLDPPQKGGIMAHGGQAYILCERNQLDAALVHVQLGIGQLDHVGGAWAGHVLYRVLARIQQAQGKWPDALDSLNKAYQLGKSVQVSLVETQAAALRARLHLIQGDLDAAAVWAEDSRLNIGDAQAGHPGWREMEYLTLARVLDAKGRHEEALALLERLKQSAQAEERNGSAISILTLQSLIFQSQHNPARALECLAGALILAEPEGFVRAFLDEGEPMRLLLLDYQSALKNIMGNDRNKSPARLLAYVDKLLAAFSQPFQVVAHESGTVLEPLSEREREILRLIAIGLTNQEIAIKLVIAVSTVKSHINNLYAKLGTQRRTQAIVIARETGLLSD
jgi:ATP/maltotriose-dependent transcriptional regulator MalT